MRHIIGAVIGVCLFAAGSFVGVTESDIVSTITLLVLSSLLLSATAIDGAATL